LSPMHRVSDSALSSPPFAEPGQVEVEAALAAMSPADRLRRYWRMQEIAVARSWALVERSGLVDPRARVGFVIRSRFPEWSDAEVERLLHAISQRESYDVWLDRLHFKADRIAARL
jgi:hypothetical protein